MLFRRVVLCALLVAAIAGFLLSAVQHWRVIPIIHAAERFEQSQASIEPGAAAPPGLAQAHEHGPADGAAHAHPAAAWEPSPGAQRIGFTVLSNVLTAAGFALMMLAVMAAALRRRAVTRLDWHYGLLWGAAGYVVFFVAPALGLPPEIPGAMAAPLAARQLWWVLSVTCTAGGLAGAVFGKGPWRWAALALLVAPYLVGVPLTPANPFAQHSPADAAALAQLAQRFVWATALANALFWLALGSASGWAARRFLNAALEQGVHGFADYSSRP